MTLADVQQAAQALTDAGLLVSANAIVAQIGGSKRDIVRLLRDLRAAVPVPPTPQGTAVLPPARPTLAPMPGPPSERPLTLCQLCGYAAWFELTAGDWRCRLC